MPACATSIVYLQDAHLGFGLVVRVPIEQLSLPICHLQKIPIVGEVDRHWTIRKINGVRIGAGAVVRNAIIDKEVVVPAGARIGVDLEEDQARGFVVEDGLTVLAKQQPVPEGRG